MQHPHQPTNVTASVLVAQNQQCNINIVFSDDVGISEPYELPFSKCMLCTLIQFNYCNYLLTGTFPPFTTTPSPNSTLATSTPVSSPRSSLSGKYY